MTPDWIVEPFTVIDGGLSTALEALGHHSTGLLWTAQLVIDRPEVVVAAHRSFVEAGAEVVDLVELPGERRRVPGRGTRRGERTPSVGVDHRPGASVGRAIRGGIDRPVRCSAG